MTKIPLNIIRAVSVILLLANINEIIQGQNAILIPFCYVICATAMIIISFLLAKQNGKMNTVLLLISFITIDIIYGFDLVSTRNSLISLESIIKLIAWLSFLGVTFILLKRVFLDSNHNDN